MRKMVVELLALAVLLAGARMGWGQSAPEKKEKPPAKSRLEEMLEQALRANPDLAVATAKVAEAQAELNRTRLQVTQKVVALYYALETQKEQVATLEARFKRAKELYETKALPQAAFAEAGQQLRTAKAKLAELEVEQPYLLGKVRIRDSLLAWRYYPLIGVGRVRDGHLQAPPQLRLRAATGPVAEKIRRALDRRLPLKTEFKNTPMDKVVKSFTERASDVLFLVKPGEGPLPTITGELPDLPLGAALEWLEDALPDYRIVVREYGFLIAPANKVPPGAVSVHEFWKGAEARAAARDSHRARVEGTVRKVDPSGLVTISLGSDAGLAKGKTLTVYRPKKLGTLYLGTIRLIEVTPTQAVGQPVGRMSAPPAVGDKVTNKELDTW